MFKKILIIFFVKDCSAYLCADDKKLTNAEASYIFYYKNIQAGSMNMTIATLDDKINIVTKYDGNFIASLANKGHREETSSIQQKNGNLIPIKYTYIDEKRIL